jgi:hypothetical protein
MIINEYNVDIDLEDEIQSFYETSLQEYNNLFDNEILNEETYEHGEGDTLANQRTWMAKIKNFFGVIIKWLKDHINTMLQYFKKAKDWVFSKFKKPIEVMEKEFVDISILGEVEDILDKEEKKKSTSNVTCGELLRKSGWKHPTNNSKFVVFLNPGAGIALKAVEDFEKAILYFAGRLSSLHLERVSFNIADIERQVMKQVDNFNRELVDKLDSIANRTKGPDGIGGGTSKWYTGYDAEVGIESQSYIGASHKLDLMGGGYGRSSN